VTGGVAKWKPTSGLVPADLPKHKIFVWSRAHDEVQREIKAAGSPRLPFEWDSPFIDTEAIWGASYEELEEFEEAARAAWEAIPTWKWWRREERREKMWLAALAAQRRAACFGLEVMWR
jgi:hypothetical protein